jgi:hypothetical protein
MHDRISASAVVSSPREVARGYANLQHRRRCCTTSSCMQKRRLRSQQYPLVLVGNRQHPCSLDIIFLQCNNRTKIIVGHFPNVEVYFLNSYLCFETLYFYTRTNIVQPVMPAPYYQMLHFRIFCKKNVK